MKFVKRQFAKIIDKFWRPKPFNDFDDMMFCVGDLWLQDLARENEKVRADRIAVLIDERDKLKAQKKKTSHIQAEIVKLRAEQLGT